MRSSTCDILTVLVCDYVMSIILFNVSRHIVLRVNKKD